MQNMEPSLMAVGFTDPAQRSAAAIPSTATRLNNIHRWLWALTAQHKGVQQPHQQQQPYESVQALKDSTNHKQLNTAIVNTENF